MKLIGGIFLTLICAFCGAICAVWGASLAGLPESNWSLEPLLYFAIGIVMAGCACPALLLFLPPSRKGWAFGRVAVAVSGALVLAFLSGMIACRVRRNNEAAERLLHVASPSAKPEAERIF